MVHLLRLLSLQSVWALLKLAPALHISARPVIHHNGPNLTFRRYELLLILEPNAFRLGTCAHVWTGKTHKQKINQSLTLKNRTSCQRTMSTDKKKMDLFSLCCPNFGDKVGIVETYPSALSRRHCLGNIVCKKTASFACLWATFICIPRVHSIVCSSIWKDLQIRLNSLFSLLTFCRLSVSRCHFSPSALYLAIHLYYFSSTNWNGRHWKFTAHCKLD